MISDFGLSKTEEDDSMMATACGTPGYVGRFMEIKTAEVYVLGIASIGARSMSVEIHFCEVSTHRFFTFFRKRRVSVNHFVLEEPD